MSAGADMIGIIREKGDKSMGDSGKRQRGFTLIELLIVVAIIGVLAMIAIPQYAAFKEKGYIAAMQSDMNTVRLAEEAYYAEKATYTTKPEDLAGFGFKNVSEGNTVEVKASGDIKTGFKATITSDRTSKKVDYDSETGKMAVN